MDIQLIAMDLDGTALQNDRNSFSPRLDRALLAAHDQGVAIVPITGRQYKLLPPALLRDLPWRDLVVVCNGAQVRSMRTGQVLQQYRIGRTALEQLLVLAKELKLPMEFSWDSTLHLTRQDYAIQLQDPDLVFHRDVILATRGKFVDVLDPSMPVEKVNLLCVEPPQQPIVEDFLKNVDVSGVWCRERMMEITHPNATKAQGMFTACSLLGIDPKATMALGDSGNDISMLQQAGLGIAMGNAPEHIKAAAKAVTLPNDQDGAAIAIEQYVLK